MSFNSLNTVFARVDLIYSKARTGGIVARLIALPPASAGKYAKCLGLTRSRIKFVPYAARVDPDATIHETAVAETSVLCRKSLLQST